MTRMCIPLSILAGLLALSAPPVVKAESASSGLPEALRDCVNESDDMLRLACFDREMGKLNQAATGAREVDPVDTASSEEKFGIIEKSDKKELTEIQATVVKVATSSNRIFAVLLNNDQVWRQKYVGTFHIKAGDVVTITKGNFGGFNLERNGRQVAVVRVK